MNTKTQVQKYNTKTQRKKNKKYISRQNEMH